MGSAAVLSNGFHQTNQQPNYNTEYEKILTLRDEIFADKHPRLKLPKTSPATAPPASVPVAPRTNGISKPSPMKALPVQNGMSNISSFAASVPKSTTQRAPNSLPISDFDPVLLTKGPALVREEMLRKRRAIEQSLRDQVSQKKKFSRQKLLEEEGLPDFDVTQVLERAHDIVKPVRFAQVKVANRPASSSDSFDENDYYSSQVNSWTTTEPEADASPKRHASSKEIEGGGAQAMDIDSVDADEQARSRSRPVTDLNAGKKDEVAAQAARIAELEEKLRLATERNATVNRVQTPAQEEGQIEEPEYSPPDVPQPPVLPQSHQPQSHAQTVDTGAQQREPALRRSSRPLPPQSREYAARNEPAPSPVQNDMRIVRNHITSPLAPQPARVSPLAVAKAPPVSQVRGVQQDERRSPRAGPANPGSKRVSPDQPIQPLTNRKRRRGKNSGDMVRNVAPRRENLSPDVRVKEEPVSPQLRTTTLEAWRPPRTEEVQRPVYVDTISPQRRGSNNGGPAPRRGERLAQVQMSEPGRPFSPVERRNVHGNGHFIEINDEPDLRRVATTRQIHMPPPLPEPSKPFRASIQPQPISRYYPDQPLSPAPHHPQRAPSRHASIAIPPQPRIVVDQYGNRFVEAPAPQERQMSVVPITRPGDHDPRYEQPRRPTIIRNPSYEIGPDGLHYVRRVPSPTSPRYVQRAPSPVSPRYVQRAPSPVSPRYARPVNHFEQGGYIDDSYTRGENSVRVISHADDQGAARFDNFTRPREPVTRLQSVRPVSHYEAPRVPSVRPEQERVVNFRPVPPPYEAPRIQSIQPERDRMASVRPMTGQYEMPREQFARVQSVRPEQERIVSLGGRREVVPRPASVRPEDTYMRPVGPYVDERPMYTYVPEPQERRYVEDGYNDRVVYEAPGSGSRRNVQ